jgi:hypothetical protein
MAQRECPLEAYYEQAREWIKRVPEAQLDALIRSLLRTREQGTISGAEEEEIVALFLLLQAKLKQCTRIKPSEESTHE